MGNSDDQIMDRVIGLVKKYIKTDAAKVGLCVELYYKCYVLIYLIKLVLFLLRSGNRNSKF